MRSKNGVLYAAAKEHKTIFAPKITYNVLFFLQTFITNYLRNVKKPGRRLGRHKLLI
jgi:hypothetical protein